VGLLAVDSSVISFAYVETYQGGHDGYGRDLVLGDVFHSLVPSGWQHELAIVLASIV